MAKKNLAQTSHPYASHLTMSIPDELRPPLTEIERFKLFEVDDSELRASRLNEGTAEFVT